MSISKTEVSQLYVSIFGRASEGEGNQYWQKQKSLKIAADEMLSSQPAKDYFGSTLNSNQEFIEFIYENTLNKTAEDDPDGVKYWVDLLESGKSKGEIVSSLIKAIKTYAPGAENYDETNQKTIDAYNQFENRVEVSNYMADTVEEAPSDYETSTAFGKGLIVSHLDSSISSAKSEVNSLKIDSSEDTYDENNPFYHKALITDDNVSFFDLGGDLLFEVGSDDGEDWMSISTYTIDGNTITQTTITDNETISLTVDEFKTGSSIKDDFGTYNLTSVYDIEHTGSRSWDLSNMSASEYLNYMQEDTASYDGLKAEYDYDLYHPNNPEKDVGMAYAYENKLYVVRQMDGGYELEISNGTTIENYYLGEIA